MINKFHTKWILATFFLILLLVFHFTFISSVHQKCDDTLHFWKIRDAQRILYSKKIEFPPVGKNADGPFKYYNPSTPLRILFIGDSFDRDIVTTLCSTHTGNGSRKYYFESLWPRNFATNWTDISQSTWPTSRVCVKGNLTVANIFSLTVGAGKRINDAGVRAQTMEEELFFVATSFKNFTGFAPDLVSFKSIYWDIKGLSERYICQNHLCNDTSFYLAEGFLESYQKNLTRSIHILKKSFPNSRLAIKVDPLWQQEGMNRFFVKYGMTMTVFNEIMNSMIMIKRKIADENKIILLDFMKIFLPLQPSTYLNDDIHPSRNFLALELNIVISYLACMRKLVLQIAIF